MQNEKTNQKEEAGLTEVELHFVHSLEQTLGQAMADGDNVTSIWSRLKPDQRARIAEDYLDRLRTTDPAACNAGDNDGEFVTRKNPALSPARQDRQTVDGNEEISSFALDPASVIQRTTQMSFGSTVAADLAAATERQAQQTPVHPTEMHIPTAQSEIPTPRHSPPPGYPADFNPLAGFPGLEPSNTGPRPEDIIAGALPGFNGSGSNPMDVLRGLLPSGLVQPDLRQPMPGTTDIPPHSPTGAPDHSRSDAWPNPARHPGPDLDGDTGPAAPNFWPLWIDQQDSLLKQCLKLMSGNMDDAQDALSEAMVKASTKFEDSMDEIRNHRAWLSRIVHNACIDLHRQNRRKAEYREETHGSADTPASPMTAPIIPSPEESYLAGEQLDQLETALLAMHEKLRKPLLMRCVQDRSYDEIAEALGLSNCAVRKRVQLAREHLRGAGIQ